MFSSARDWVTAGTAWTAAGVTGVATVGAVGAVGAGEAGSLLDTQIVYGENALQGDLYHAFPSLFDSTIMTEGEVTYGTGTYVQYNLQGFINGAAGAYQVGGYWVTSTLFYMTHHHFLP